MHTRVICRESSEIWLEESRLEGWKNPARFGWKNPLDRVLSSRSTERLTSKEYFDGLEITQHTNSNN